MDGLNKWKSFLLLSFSGALISVFRVRKELYALRERNTTVNQEPTAMEQVKPHFYKNKNNKWA